MLRKASGGGEKEERIWQTTGKWGNAEGRRLCGNCCGGFLSHRAAGAESGWSTGECWPRWSSNFLSVVCGLCTCRETSWNTAARPQRGTGQLGNKDANGMTNSPTHISSFSLHSPSEIQTHCVCSALHYTASGLFGSAGWEGGRERGARPNVTFVLNSTDTLAFWWTLSKCFEQAV